ncbi:hypothetical protein KKD04_00080 [Patescibacteria group bacterium]|nr:hypothetical protein [Patescibacteria group bacterium]
MKKTLCILFILLFCLWAGIRIVALIQFDRGCEGYLKRAADANTVELAKKQLKVALDYIERKSLTTGYTSILYRTPDEDIGFWYTNIKSSLAELEQMNPNATQLERSNLLMKLRETLLDEGQSIPITAPYGISIYPNNVAIAILGWLSAVLTVVWIVIMIPWNEFRSL